MAVAWKQQRAVRLDDLTEAEIERDSIELWEGEIVNKMSPSGMRHSHIAGEIFARLRDFALTQSGLRAAPDQAGFYISRSPDTLLSPDASLFRRRPGMTGTWYRFCPELVVEVKSQQNSLAALRAKRDLYLRHGAEQVWIVDADSNVLSIHFADGRLMEADGGTIECEGIATGLTLDLDALFAA